MKLILGIILNVAVAKFTPTSEWQVWGEDEPLPEGLHYRFVFEFLFCILIFCSE